MYQAENRFPEEGETFKVTALVNIDSRIQMVHVVQKYLFNVPCSFSDKSIDLFLCLCVLHTVIVNMSRRSTCLSGQSGRGPPYFTCRVYPASLESGHSPGCNILTHTQPSSRGKMHFIARVSAAIQPTELIKKKGAAGVFCRLLPNWHRTRDACLIQMPQTLDVAPQGSWRVYW